MATPNTRDDRSKASRYGLRPSRLALLSKTYTTSWDITVLSRIANVSVLEVAHDAFGVLFQHRHVVISSYA